MLYTLTMFLSAGTINPKPLRIRQNPGHTPSSKELSDCMVFVELCRNTCLNVEF